VNKFLSVTLVTQNVAVFISNRKIVY